MPKQTGTYRIKGVHQGNCYYKIKGGTGDVFRTINPTMSERVKTDPAFRNLRKAAQEFKTYTTAAQGLYSGLGNRISPILPSKTLTDLTKLMKQYLQNGATAPVGEREFRANGWQDAAADFLNARCKTDIADYSSMIIQASIIPSAQTTRINAKCDIYYVFSADAGKEYLRRGFDMVQIRFLHMNVRTCEYDPETETHGRTFVQFTEIGRGITQQIGSAGPPTTLTRQILSYAPQGENGLVFQRLVLKITPYKSSAPDNLYYAHQGILLFPFDYSDGITTPPSRN